MKQQIYNLEEFATKYHLQDIFGAYAAYFTINRKDNENENDADFKVSDTAEDSFNNMVKERTLFTKLLLVESGSCTIMANMIGVKESISLVACDFLIVTAKTIIRALRQYTCRQEGHCQYDIRSWYISSTWCSLPIRFCTKAATRMAINEVGIHTIIISFNSIPALPSR